MARFTIRGRPAKCQFVNFIDQERLRAKLPRTHLMNHAGYGQNLLDHWISGVEPGAWKLDTVLQSLGYRLAIVPLDHPAIVRKGD